MEATATQETTTEAQIDNRETPTAPKVENPEAVLKKNQELLGKLAKEKSEREALAARVAEFEAAEAQREEERLKKNGEIEKVYQKRIEEREKALSAKDAEIEALFSDSARFQLSTEIGNLPILEGTAPKLAKLLLLDEIKPAREDGKLVWRRQDTDEQINLKEFLPTLQDAYGEFFKADNNPGGDAPGNTGKVNAGGTKRSQMDTKAKLAFIKKHGQDAFLKLPN